MNVTEGCSHNFVAKTWMIALPSGARTLENAQQSRHFVPDLLIFLLRGICFWASGWTLRCRDTQSEPCRGHVFSSFFRLPILLPVQDDVVDEDDDAGLDADDDGGGGDDGRSHESRILFLFGNKEYPSWRHAPSTLAQSSKLPFRHDTSTERDDRPLFFQVRAPPLDFVRRNPQTASAKRRVQIVQHGVSVSATSVHQRTPTWRTKVRHP